MLIHRDFCQQEVRIAAVVSGDMALLEACESGDVYLGIARQLGFISESMSAPELKAVRGLFKTVVLGIQYGLGARSLAVRTGISLSEAAEILARLRARFRVFEAYAQSVVERAGLLLEDQHALRLDHAMPVRHQPAHGEKFPDPINGRRGLARLLYPGGAPRNPDRRAGARCGHGRGAARSGRGDASAALDRCMRDASAVVLRGYELPTDVQLIGAGQKHQRYFDDRGEAMWNTVTRLVAKLEEQTA